MVLKLVALVVLASVAGESWVLAPLYHTERPVHVSAVALCDAWCARASACTGRVRGGARAVHGRVRGGARAVHGRVPSPTVGDGSVSENDVFIYKVMP